MANGSKDRLGCNGHPVTSRYIRQKSPARNLLHLLHIYLLGVRGGIRTHGPRIHPTSAFAAAARAGAAFVVWTVPSP